MTQARPKPTMIQSAVCVALIVTPPSALIVWISGNAGSDSGIGDADGLADEVTSPAVEAALGDPTDGRPWSPSPFEHAATAAATRNSATPHLAAPETLMATPFLGHSRPSD